MLKLFDTKRKYTGYDGEEYIDNIFECFSKWERKDIEVFLIDDGSSDNIFKLIK